LKARHTIRKQQWCKFWALFTRIIQLIYRAGNKLRDANTSLESDYTDENLRLHNALKEKETFMDAINELTELQREDDDPETWNTFRLL
jgi:hypothetical protein